MIGRRARTATALAALAAILLGLLPAASVQAASPEPRVVLVVGPVGGLTETYRALARQGAAEARRYTNDVIEIYSPNATWPKVKAALQGASVVVYLGHGNGFPSPYGTQLRRAVQNGFGLNPVAGRGDTAHQYFGEGPVSEQVRLASGAVVLLFRLCYASGNSEPGVPEGTIDTARQRIDNFSAGFLAAGASAVIADAYAAPAPYLRALLGSKATARRAWTRATTANGHVSSFASSRTTGAVAFMDPENASSGFMRSLVLAAGAAGAVPAGPGRTTNMPAGGWQVVLPPQPSHAPDAFDLGATPGAPTLSAMPIAGSTIQLDLPVELAADQKLGSYRLGTRWIPLDVTGGAGDPVVGDETALVAPESAASLVEVAPASTSGNIVTAPVTLPAAVGRYRLEVTIHGADGVALGYDVQAAIPGVVVHVGGPGAAWIDAPSALSLTSATLASVQVLVTNGEADAWGSCLARPTGVGTAVAPACPTVRLVGRWVPLTNGTAADPMERDLTVPAASAVTTWLAGTVPAVPGTYLLVASLERSNGTGAVEVLGRPVTITVEVAAAPLVPATPGAVPTPGDLLQPAAPTADPADPLIPGLPGS